MFAKSGFTYEILIRIDSHERESSWSGLQLNLLDRSPPSIRIECQTKSLCYPYIPIGQKINPVRVGLIGVCSESCDGALTYEWTVYGVDTETNDETPLEEAAEYLVGASEIKMALSKEFFDKFGANYKDFSIKLSVWKKKNLPMEKQMD